MASPIPEQAPVTSAVGILLKLGLWRADSGIAGERRAQRLTADGNAHVARVGGASVRVVAEGSAPHVGGIADRVGAALTAEVAVLEQPGHARRAASEEGVGPVERGA